VLPFSGVGIGLLLLAVALFVAETQVGGVGALAVGGIAALAVAGAMLFDSADPALRPTLWVVVVVAVVIGAGFTAAARRVMRARARPVGTGTAEMMGVVGTARAPIGPGDGRVLVNGEIWSARAAGGVEIPAGQRVRVVKVHTDDLTLTVEPREE
jgi:membrane-bound serine protease (ClpP class)